MADSLVHHYHTKLHNLRVIELKQILNQVGGSKNGLKKDLVDRLLVLIREDYNLRKDDVAKKIDEIYASKVYASKSGKNQNVPQKSEIRCVCGIPSKTDGMIKCEDPSCGALQHAACVVIPQNPNDGIASAPKPFYCELCRLIRSDPFSVTSPEIPLPTAKLPSDSQKTSKSFNLSSANKDLLLSPDYDVQAWCMLLNDDVLFRVQWPKHAELKVNGLQVQQLTNRSGSMQLGANGRDNGVSIAQFVNAGCNWIYLTANDDRPFCFGVRLVKRRSFEQVMELIPGESLGEKLEEAVSRVSRCLGGGGGGGGDLEVVADFVPVNLRCPMSGLRMKVAGRFKPCVHMGCFDLEVFVEMNMRSKKWQCPICLKNYCLDNLIIDPYFNRVLANLGQDVNEVEVKPDGSWRVKWSGHLGWHAPDGSSIEAESNGNELGDSEVVVLLSDSEDEVQKEALIISCDEKDGVEKDLELLAEKGSGMKLGGASSVKRVRDVSELGPFSPFPTKRRSCYVNKGNVVHEIN